MHQVERRTESIGLVSNQSGLGASYLVIHLSTDETRRGFCFCFCSCFGFCCSSSRREGSPEGRSSLLSLRVMSIPVLRSIQVQGQEQQQTLGNSERGNSALPLFGKGISA